VRILLDECVNHRLRNHIPGHEVQSARFAGFGGLKNGELLQAAKVDADLEGRALDRRVAALSWNKARSYISGMETRGTGISPRHEKETDAAGCVRRHSARMSGILQPANFWNELR
jgi:hypothetical protein